MNNIHTQLNQLRLAGMADALAQQFDQPHTYEELGFLERLSLLVNSEVTCRDNRKITSNGTPILFPSGMHTSRLVLAGTAVQSDQHSTIERDDCMNWEMFGALAEMLGGAAVIISLLFVGFQLRQQSNIERAKAQRDLLMQIRKWISCRRKIRSTSTRSGAAWMILMAPTTGAVSNFGTGRYGTFLERVAASSQVRRVA